MGLAPYGKPSLVDKLEKILILKEDGTFKLNLDYYIFHKSLHNEDFENCEPKVGTLYSNKIYEILVNPELKMMK